MLYVIHNLTGILADFHNIAGGHDEHVLLRHANGRCDRLVRYQMAVLTVYRKRKLRMQQGVNQLDFLLTCMTGYVGIFGDDLHAAHSQLIDDLGHLLFIARDRSRTHNDNIVRLDGYLAVHAGCHTGQSRHGLALASCRNEDRLLIRIVL